VSDDALVNEILEEAYAASSGPQPAAGTTSRPFTVTNLAELATRGVAAPELTCDQLLYAGGVHSINGQPDGGKSTFLYHCSLSLLRSGRAVVIFDEESGEDQVAEKLLGLGAAPAELERLHYVQFPGRTWDAADVAAVDELLRATRPALVGWDSAAAFLSRAGLDEDRATDVTRFYADVLLPCARVHGAAVLVADHLTKNGAVGRFARGSGAKLASTDVSYMLDVIKPFSRAQDGVLKLIVSKDRRGYLHREHELRVRVADGGMRLELTRVEGTTDDPATAGLPPAAVKLLEVLRAAQSPTGVRSLVDGVAERYGHGLKRNTVSGALNELADRGLADCASHGPQQEKTWWST